MTIAGVDEVGSRFGKLVVLERGAVRKGVLQRWYWRCRCDCGKETVVASASLRNGDTRSCGCLRRDRGAAARARVAELWPTGLSARLIGIEIGITKGAVIGHAHRNGLAPRGSPLHPPRKLAPQAPRIDPRAGTLPPLPSLQGPFYVAPSLRGTGALPAR